MSNTAAFHPAIPQPHRDSIAALADLAADWMATCNGDTFGDDPKIEPVEWKSRDGFISSNMGGFSVSQSYYCGASSGIFHSAGEREYIEGVQARALADWLQETGRAEYPDDEEGRELFYEYESDYMNDLYTILEIEAFIPSDTPDKVQVSCLLHYKDAPYHRSKYAEEVYCKNHNLDGFDPARVLAEITAAYGAVK